MKFLFVATVRSHIGQFHMPLIRELKKAGHEVHAAFKDNSADKKGLDVSDIDREFNVPFERSPYSVKNIHAYRMLKQIIDSGGYEIIHCHTPMGGVVARLAAMNARKHGTKVIYTAHGFHFYKGAPYKNWMLYFPVEKLLSAYTDVLITINQEDYDLAVRKKFLAKKIELINGVGVDLTKFSPVTEDEKAQARKELGMTKDQFVLLYAADLSHRKNQPMLFRTMERLEKKKVNALLLLPGQPILQNEYEHQCQKMGISHMVRFLGYRRDIDLLLAACDCVVSSSRQEGLPINLIEAAARGRYIIATDVRGNADVVKQSNNGALVPLDDDETMAEMIAFRYDNPDAGEMDTESINVYSQERVIPQIMGIYREVSGYEEKK